MGNEPATDQPRHLTRKGQATRERIVSAAAELMHERGVAGTSTDDVQKAAAVSGSQLYHYFPGKRALVAAVIERMTDTVLDAQQPLLGRLDSMQALRAWAEHLVAIQNGLGCQGGCPIGSLAAELADTDPEARAALAVGFHNWQHAIRAGLCAMHDRGHLRADADPDALALALLAALQGGILLTQLHRDTRPLQAALSTMLDHIEAQTTRGST